VPNFGREMLKDWKDKNKESLACYKAKADQLNERRS
jgi:hypothetical protein